MKIICKINNGQSIKGFQPCKVVVEAALEKLYELEIGLGSWPNDDKPIQIKSGGVTLAIKTLTVSCTAISVPTLLLHVELCKFVLEQSPELFEFSYKETSS